MSRENPQAAPSAEERRDAEFFPSRIEALRWLKAQGYKVSQNKFYADIRETGFPVVADDGRVSRYQVQVYAENLKAVKQATRTPDEISLFEARYRTEKSKADKAEMELEDLRRERDELWLHAADAWSVVAGVICEVKDALSREMYDRLAELVEAAGGEAVRGPELYEAILAVIDAVYNDIAERGLDIQWESAP